MTKVELLKAIEYLPNDIQIYLECTDGSVSDFHIEPITVSCDDKTVIGYVITKTQEMH